MNDKTIQIIIMGSLVFINMAVWFIAGMIHARKLPIMKVQDGTAKDKKFQLQGMTAEESHYHDADAFSTIALLKKAGRLPLEDEKERIERTVNFWYDTKVRAMPVNEYIDIIDSAGRTHHKVKMIRRNPIKFEPDFLRYKNVISWRYSD